MHILDLFAFPSSDLCLWKEAALFRLHSLHFCVAQVNVWAYCGGKRTDKQRDT